MRTKRFHGLKRPKIRQSMNKYNLYNLSRLPRTNVRGTYFQQKWWAKAATRAYHGEQIREKQWQRMFTSRIKSVIPMNHRYLAHFDGSEQAAGRGSGLEENVTGDPRMARKPKPIPYMNMTYSPTERRLDTAIFRALFASSTRQARQFVIHGGVKVNGKKMPYPGYLLNPGDMFQVEPERVLFATGAPKDPYERRATRVHHKRVAKASEATETSSEATLEESAPDSEEAAPVDEATVEKKKRREHKDSLQSLLANARNILEDKGTASPSAKRKQEIRAFAATVRRAIGNVNRTATDDLDTQISQLVNKLSISERPKPQEAPKPSTPTTDPSLQAQIKSDAPGSASEQVAPASRKLITEALREIRENPIDASKPYATPWRPRPFMAAFAFVPRYLEVNHNICSAVYLRHPVARPGLAEVPTPFPVESGMLAYNWYLRRR